ncbi:cofactor for cytoplasmic methionyl-and glutamyl-tRNA synthetases Asc1 [Schizosaccharomyces pombe]|uniref:tRNA-aminoacylation cofactor arc1 n=1 Tax=Schizosaccharomyces pombe (strain 972 / ATCC 24843) TaxID=284812 RepID=ARC1_SCHPO|nr:putative methionyl and glutamyl-tRNA synthetase cofactor [Schizosaccharomyces pombe]Q9P6K7.1 RecName: Full=tRNA-aminoacylation cofactor arc1 [Schizosaccharomyces pombe 972h-]CAB90791.1 cofactor for methionyl-and glutamyl-tRNA synthetases (predicted) [Schizosaccharomyces pombe]|eukprot:NP_594656.1 putative methionyl and glutamyl-tRNA synthetase cofactor [Schizosaccharomyces pombe]
MSFLWAKEFCVLKYPYKLFITHKFSYLLRFETVTLNNIRSPQFYAKLTFSHHQPTVSGTMSTELKFISKYLQISIPETKEGPVSSLFKAVSEQKPELLGNTDFEKAQILEWTTKAFSPIETQSIVEQLDEFLKSSTFIAQDSGISVADLAVYARIHSYICGLSAKEGYKLNNVCRWFDFIQHQESVMEAANSMSMKLANIDLNAPKIQRPSVIKKDKKEKKEGKPSQEASVKSVEKAPKGLEGAKKEKQNKKEKKDKKDKKDKKEKAPKEPPKAATPVPSMIDFRIGFIEKAVKHPNADSLYVSTIHCGDAEGPRTVCSGLVKYIPLEQMQQRKVIVVANLKPVNMRSVKSQAMVFCASSPDKSVVEFVLPPENAEIGDRLTFEGFDTEEPEAQLNPKRKIWEAIQPGFTSGEDLICGYKDESGLHRLFVKGKKDLGFCKAQTVVNGTLS